MSIKEYVFKLLRLILLIPCLSVSAQVTGGNPVYYVYIENGKQGVKNDTDQVLIPAVYDQMGWTDSEFKIQNGVVGYKKGDKWGLIGLKNNEVTEAIYEGLSIEETGSLINAVKRDKLTNQSFHGLINSRGETIISFKYSGLTVYHERVLAYFPTGNNLNRVGLMDLNEKILIPFEYLTIRTVGLLRFLAEKPKGTFTLFNDQGVKMTPLALDSLSAFNRGYAIIWKDQFAGLIDVHGEIVVPMEYREIRILSDGVEVRKYDSWYELNAENIQNIILNYDEVRRLNDSVYLVEAHNKLWFINKENKRLEGEVYDEVGPFENGLAVARKEGRWGVIYSKSGWLLPPVYKQIRRKNGFFYVSDARGLWRIFDQFGVEKSKGLYNEIAMYDHLHFPVKKGNYWGLIDRNGQQKVNCVFDSIGKITGEYISVKFKGLFGIIDLEGNWIVIPSSPKKEVINEILYLEKWNGMTSIKSYFGDIVYFSTNRIQLYSDYFIEHLSNGKVWKINFSGVIQAKEVLDVVHQDPIEFSEFEDIYIPSEGLTGVRKDGKYGFVDDQNRLRIANRYDSIKSFSDGFAAINLLGRWGFIDMQENIVIQPLYDWVDSFQDGLCVVKKDEKFFLINKQGRMLFTSGFDDLELLPTERYKVRRAGLYGLVARDGTMLVNFVYDELEDIGNGSVIIKKLDKYGVVNYQGIDQIPRIYDDLHFDPAKSHYFGKIQSNWEAKVLLN